MATSKSVPCDSLYFFDCGVLRALQGRLHDEPSAEEQGHLLETYLFNELSAAISYQGLGGELSFWRTADGNEVDFIWQRASKRVAIEVKSSKTWKPSFEKGILALASERKSAIKHFFGVYQGTEILKKSWGWVFPVEEFLNRLSAGKIIG